MTATIFQKARTLVLGNLHTLLDKAIDWNSSGALKQYARDLQEARDGLDDQAAGLRSDAKALPNEVATLRAQHKAADENITALLGDSDAANDHLAAPLEAKLMMLEQQIDIKQGQLATTTEQLAKFTEVVSKLDMKLASVNARIGVIETLEQTRNSQERATKMLSGVSLSEMPNVDNVEARLRRQTDVSSNKLDRELGRVTESVGGSTMDAEVAARLAARRATVAK